MGLYNSPCYHLYVGDISLLCYLHPPPPAPHHPQEIKVGLDEPRIMSLDDALEFINDDELVEVRVLFYLCFFACLPNWSFALFCKEKKNQSFAKND